MEELLARRRAPFITIAVVLGIATLAVFRLPESFIVQLENTGLLSLTQRGWAFRLLALIAIVQAVYVGFVMFRTERIKEAREQDPKVARLSRADLIGSLSWNAAGIIFLTVVYGLAALAFSGFRTGFWLFVFVAGVQIAWYYLQIGAVARWLDFQVETLAGPASSVWEPDPSTYCPPLTRGLAADTPPRT